jgi:hypothetical protein
MKKLTLALGLAVIATPALASKARLEALGEDNFGSYYINDNRNQFLNPARINEAKDLVTYEFGSSSTGTAVTADSAGAPKAEGGFNKSWNNMVWGLHFGNSTPSATVVRGLVGNNNLQERNVWDLFVGGDAGLKWGANLTYEGYSKSDATATTNKLTSNSLRARVGVISGDLDAFAQVSLKGDANDYQGNTVEGKSSYFLGAGYMLNSYKLFADYLHIGTDYSVTATAGTENEWKTDRIRLGAARQERLNDKTNLFTKLMVVHQKIENDGATSATAGINGETTNTTLPIVVGLEYDAASWLALRTSVVQNVYGNSKVDPKTGSKSSGTLANTAVNAGASLKFGELTVDGLISTDSDGDNSDGTSQSTAGGNGSLRTDSLMSRVSMTYRF